ncbi:dioxygenase [Pelomonas sp. HMWF004]|nr:dioxygenase [Pelomonas sp. HMWF004]
MSATDAGPALPSYFLCHGGGPWTSMQGPFREQLRGLEAGLMDVPHQLPRRPRAVLVVSAHWVTDDFTVSTAAAPGMVYDYAGFPPEMYQVRYPALGAPALAERAAQLLEGQGWTVRRDAERGMDHGVFTLLQTMYPEADLPVAMMSLRRSFDADEHFRAGQALAALREEGVLLIGSGMSCHERGPGIAVPSAGFDAWLRQQLLEAPPASRRRALAHWASAPYARSVHPHEDHLLPLMVAAGAAEQEPASCIYGERLMGRITVSSYRFGGRKERLRFDDLGTAASGDRP